MQLVAPKRKIMVPLKSLFSSFLIGFVLLYLIFHALNGNHGVYALFKEQKRASSNALILADLQQERQKLEHRVNMISGETLDLDLLEEQAKRVLGYSNPNEIVYILPQTQLGTSGGEQ